MQTTRTEKAENFIVALNSTINFIPSLHKTQHRQNAGAVSTNAYINIHTQ